MNETGNVPYSRGSRTEIPSIFVRYGVEIKNIHDGHAELKKYSKLQNKKLNSVCAHRTE